MRLCAVAAAMPNKRLLQSRKDLVGPKELALRLALRIGMLATPQNRETLGGAK